MNGTLWGLQVVVAGVFVMAAVPKVTADPQAVEGSLRWGWARWAGISSAP